MSFTFDVDRTNLILRCRFGGSVTDAEIKEFYRLATEHAAKFDPHFGITDFSAITSFEVSPQTVRELAESVPAMPNPARLRVVVAPSDVEFGIARLFELEGGHTRPNLHIVRTLREAWALVGVQDARFEPL